MTNFPRLSLKALCAVSACLGVTSFAGAQTPKSTTSGYTLKIGLLFPSSGGTITSPTGTTATVKPRLMTYGLSEDVGKTNAISSLTYGYYGDYFEQGSKSTTVPVSSSVDGTTTTGTATGKASGYAIGIQAKAGGSSSSTYSPYAGIGIGYYHVKGSLDGYDQTGSSATFSASKSGVGGKLFVGVQTKSGILVEGEYDDIPEADAKYSDGSTAYKSKMSGFGVRIGYKI